MTDGNASGTACISITDNSTGKAILSIDGSHANGTALQIDNSAGDGDVSVEWQLSGTTTWLMGIEDGDSDSLKICHDSTIGTDERLSFLTASTVFNEDSADIDFRVESVDETHMIFVEGSTNRVSIGDSTDSPAATLEITNHASAGAYNVPLLQLNGNDVDARVVDINAANTTEQVIDITADSVTTARVINISADGLTSGEVLYIASDSSSTTARNIVNIIQDNASASGAVALRIQQDSTADIINVFDGATEVFTILNGGNVGIGTIAPGETLTVAEATGGTLALHRADADNAISSTNVIGTIKFTGKDDSATLGEGARIEAQSIGTWNTGSDEHIAPTDLHFYCQDSSSTNEISAITDAKMSIKSSGKVGIGTNLPSQLLELSSGGSTYIEITADDDGASTNNAGILLSEATTLMWYIRNRGDQSNRLELTDASLDGAILTQGETSAWDWSSDINLKTDISVIPDALSKINQIRGVNYKWKKYKSGASNILPIVDAETGLTAKGEQGWTDEYWEEMRSIRDINRIGVIAQEVNVVMPEAVNTDIDGEWTVKRGLLIPLLIEAVKELSAKVTALENA